MGKRSAKPVKPVGPLAAQIKLDVRPDTPFYYVNYMGVTHSVYDFTISVARLPSQLSSEQQQSAEKGGPVVVEATLQLIVPPMLIDGLIRALVDQKQKYAETVAKAAENDPKQQHVEQNRSIH